MPWDVKIFCMVTVENMVSNMSCLFCLTRLRDTFLSSTQIHIQASICLKFLRTEAKSTSTPWWIRHRFCIESFLCILYCFMHTWLSLIYFAYLIKMTYFAYLCIFSGPSSLKHFAVAASEDAFYTSDRAQKVSRGAACLPCAAGPSRAASPTVRIWSWFGHLASTKVVSS